MTFNDFGAVETRRRCPPQIPQVRNGHIRAHRPGAIGVTAMTAAQLVAYNALPDSAAGRVAQLATPKSTRSDRHDPGTLTHLSPHSS